MAGARISAEEALGLGLVDRVVPAESLTETVAALSSDALGASRDHVSGIKSMVPG